MSQAKNAKTKFTQIFRSVEVESETDKRWEEAGEFPASVREIMQRGADAGLTRKNFMALMGASLSMAGLNCFKSPIEKIVPYVNRPVGHVPGIAKYYATVKANAVSVAPVLVKTREGKPLKIEGHDDHPLYRGAITGDTVATIWDLYDPDRVRAPQKKSGTAFAEIKWEEAVKTAVSALEKSTVYIGKTNFSPSENATIDRLVKASANRSRVVYDPTSSIGEALKGEKASYGTNVVPTYRFDTADLILSLEADLLGTWLQPELYTKQFSSKRDPLAGNMNRLIVAEANMSVTGSNADDRYALVSGSHISLALGLANLLLPGSALAGNAQVRKAVENYTASAVSASTGLTEKQIVSLAEELKKYKGRSLVVSGGASAAVDGNGISQVVANLLNTILGNDGKTLSSATPFYSGANITSDTEIKKVISDIAAGKIETVVIDRANPVYELEALGFQEALSKAKNVIFLGTHINDSAALSSLILPVSHYLESWSDAESNGYYYVGQPAIRTLFSTKSSLDILLSLLGDGQSANALVQSTSQRFNKAGWNALLARGFTESSKLNTGAGRTFNAAALSSVAANPPKAGGYKLSLYSSVALGDGSGANISFRQELPDPISKMTWGNYLAVSVADARANGWKMGKNVKITAEGKSIEAPVFVQPGLRKGSVAMAIGYGQKNLGQVGANIGVNAYSLASAKSGNMITAGIPVTVEDASGSSEMATTQKHYELARERGLVRSTTLQEFQKNPRAGHEHEEVPHGGKAKGLYTAHKYTPYQWNMNIDLSKCTGCSACVVSCYSENNIPVVGKDQVLVGREMSWMRIDRYYSYQNEDQAKADPDMVDPGVYFQPVMCQHCENAPCENVCPVGATGHSDDGLNYMSYNRCIGTRYCANDCPFKVRRFNYFEFWEGKLRDPEQFALNPDVTVRSRGVIEKCSFCQQRIAEKRQSAKIAGRQLSDGEIKTACQQACPADAIVFGNIQDKEAKVTKLKEDSRAYQLLAETNVKPAVSYMVKIRNQG
ncbi:MAG: 4Fe-4S dicluster domain-containing protein [Leptospiraceae bacterium]|nr:4Fe-4S dicluster domain-containing protein [Leptospiraceae bacterium]